MLAGGVMSLPLLQEACTAVPCKVYLVLLRASELVTWQPA